MNKRIIILFVCLLVIIIPTVLLSAVFVVRDVDVVGIGEEFEFDKAKLVEDSRINLKSSIFFMSEKNATHNIELKNPDIKVVDVERIFPSKVVINITKRTPIFAVSVKDTSKYALVDRELRVVKIVDDIHSYNVVDYKSYILDVAVDVDLTENIVTLNKNEVAAYIMENIIAGFEELGYTNERFPSFVVSVVNDFDHNRTIIKTRKGASIEVLINTNIEMKELVKAGLGYFLKDVEENSANVTRGTYYFDTDLSAWKHRA